VAAALVVRGLSRSFGGFRAVSGIDLEVGAGHVHSLIGPNGAGKTTAFNCISGFLRPEAGQVLLDGRDVSGWEPHQLVTAGMARTFQITKIFGELTVHENVALAVRSERGKNLRMWRGADNSPGVRSEVVRILDMLGLDERAEAKAEQLAHGEKRVLEIAIALALQPRMLLLDEPTAGMSGGEAEGIAILIRGLTSHATVLLVEHDMEIVLSISNAVTVMMQGSVIATGTPEEISGNPRVQDAYLGTTSGDA
jgi:ABC-type branched-subunit amino acid transport system ATPase component